ncbi:uncharacterized protein I303_100573 [Kwoniella dejecticola CBS 10117]|uniref:Uncharacterized protein n=1 Tax=Kwoniella dejecticola CBS 10117 TaxID=1296121 RepID=A0A1A6AFF5_9TREE|nr:uncharacterized protein I303_00575 [Kwoniella dejecticola CBS 10117]OBR88758.1 hypothetical protein I303_00575 [Kwoniella dejecticola CBS 10117]
MGLAPAAPKALQNVLSSRTSARRGRRAPACPSASPTVFPQRPDPPTTYIQQYDDDSFTSINLPFPVKIFDQYSSLLYVNTNGYYARLKADEHVLVSFILYYTTDSPGRWYVYFDYNPQGPDGESATIGAQGGGKS